MSVIYVDTSVFLRACLVDATGHDASWKLLTATSKHLVSSELLWLEADRTAIRLVYENPTLTELPDQVANALKRIDMIPLTRDIINSARRLPQVIKSLDAVHIASAESLGAVLDYVATSDKTMIAVLQARGVTTRLPV